MRGAMDDPTLAAPDETPLADAVETPSEAPQTVRVTLGQDALDVPAALAPQLRRIYDRQAGTLGQQLQVERQARLELEASLAQRTALPPEPEPQPVRLELPPIEAPDRDLWTTAPDVASRAFAEQIARREAALLEHVEGRQRQIAEEAEARDVAVMREQARLLQEQQAAQAEAAEAERQRQAFFTKFYTEHPELKGRQKLVDRVWSDWQRNRQQYGQLTWNAASERLADTVREELAAYGVTTMPATPRTVGSQPSGSARPAPQKPAAPATLSDLIRNTQARLATARPVVNPTPAQR